MTIIDCISDLHGHYPKLEGGDLLIVAGDLTARNSEECYRKWYRWLEKCDYKKIIVIAGNHDNRIQDKGFPPMPASFNIEYLCDSGTEFVLGYPNLEPCFSEKEEKLYERKVLKIWGSPWTKKFEGMNPNCMAFTVDTEEELASKFSLIPDDIDILVTHSPPYGVLDTVTKDIVNGIKCVRGFVHCGSHSLSSKLEKLPRPRLNVFGHIHENGGKQKEYGTFTICVNASHVNEYYEPVNKPVRIII